VTEAAVVEEADVVALLEAAFGEEQVAAVLNEWRRHR